MDDKTQKDIELHGSSRRRGESDGIIFLRVFWNFLLDHMMSFSPNPIFAKVK
jgi:hypothetical protein